MESGQVALRYRSGENPGAMKLEKFIKIARQEIADKI